MARKTKDDMMVAASQPPADCLCSLIELSPPRPAMIDTTEDGETFMVTPDTTHYGAEQQWDSGNWYGIAHLLCIYNKYNRINIQ